MKKTIVSITILTVLTAFLATRVSGQVFQVPADANYPFTLTLVDATDGYTPETEKKAADVTVTYCRVTDSNSVQTYTLEDGVNWFEIGDGTGNYKALMGRDQFTDPNEVYFVTLVCTGCRTVRLRAETQMSIANHYKDVGTMAESTLQDELDTWAASYGVLADTTWTDARAGYLDNINNADLATTVAQTGDGYVPALAAQTAAESSQTILESGTYGLEKILADINLLFEIIVNMR